MEFFIKLFSQSVHPCKCVMAWWSRFTEYMCSSEMWIKEPWIKYVDDWTLFLVEPRCSLRTVLVPWCLMLPIRKSLDVRMTGPEAEQCLDDKHQCGYKCFFSFLQSKTVLKKMGLSSLSYQYLPKSGDTFVRVPWEAWKWAIALNTSGFPQLMTCFRTTSSNKGTVHLELWERAPVSRHSSSS